MSDFGAGIFDQDPHPAGGKEPQPQVPGQEPASGRRPRRRRGPADAAVEPAPQAAPQPEVTPVETPVEGEGEGRSRGRRRGRRPAEARDQGQAPQETAPPAMENPVPAPREERAPRREADWDAPPRGTTEPGTEGGFEQPVEAREGDEPGARGDESPYEGERRRRRRRGRRRGRGRRDDAGGAPHEGIPGAADGPDADAGEDLGFEDRAPATDLDREEAAPRRPENVQDRGHHHREHPRDRGHERGRPREGDHGHRGHDDRHRHHRGPHQQAPREPQPAAPAAPVRSIAVFVDLVALENEVRTAGGEVAFRKLLSFLAEGRKVARAICYLPAGTPARGSIAGSGFHVQSLAHPEELPLRAAVDAAELSGDLDAVMLVPGTHGLMTLAGVLREKGMAVETAGFGPASGTEARHRHLGRESMFIP